MKLVTAIMGDNAKDTINLCIDSVIDIADKVFFIWGTECKETMKILGEYEKSHDNLCIVERKYEHEHKGCNGRARNAYIKEINKWIKEENITEDVWVLVIDPDEFVEDITKLKEFLKSDKNKYDAYGIHMHHFIGDLGHVDSAKDVHYCPARLFKFNKDITYPEIAHSLPKNIGNQQALLVVTTLWHLAYCRNMFWILRRFKQNLEKSTIHTKDFLNKWYMAHLTGNYPTAVIKTNQLPKQLRDKFMIDNVVKEIMVEEKK